MRVGRVLVTPGMHGCHMETVVLGRGVSPQNSSLPPLPPSLPLQPPVFQYLGLNSPQHSPICTETLLSSPNTNPLTVTLISGAMVGGGGVLAGEMGKST